MLAVLLAAGANLPLETANAQEAAGARREIDWKSVDAAMARTGAAQPGNVRRYAMPRSDMGVTVRGVRIRPGLALGSWLAMTPHGDGVMAMGDMVLKESEVAPVMSALQAGGVEQTAVHHHLLHETPRVVYMHVHAMGDPLKIARTVRTALARTSTPAPSPVDAPAPGLDIDTAAIARTLGHSGKVNGGVYQVSVPRAETIRDGGVEVPASMGLATAINFQPTGGGKAAITGDFVLVASEVNPVVRALRESGIEVTSLHNHLLADDPRLFFMHFWANDDAATLARGLRAALDRTNSRGAGPGTDSAAVAAAVGRFHDALARGDSAAALALLAPDAVVLESGALETRAEYRAHHLSADIEFERAVGAARSAPRVTVRGDAAWSATTSTARGSFRGRAVNSVGAELIVLAREPDGWKIQAIHWSSRSRQR